MGPERYLELRTESGACLAAFLCSYYIHGVEAEKRNEGTSAGRLRVAPRAFRTAKHACCGTGHEATTAWRVVGQASYRWTAFPE